MLAHAPEATSAARMRVLRENRRRRDGDGLAELRPRPRRLRAYRLFTLVGVRS